MAVKTQRERETERDTDTDRDTDRETDHPDLVDTGIFNKPVLVLIWSQELVTESLPLWDGRNSCD